MQHMPPHSVDTTLPYATDVALPANAGMTSSTNRRSERSVCSWGRVPQAKAQMTYVSEPSLPATIRRHVRERASGRCEYCLLAEADAFFPHETDHLRVSGISTELNG